MMEKKKVEMNQRFGPYQVGETIGRGTFAKVKIAVHGASQTKVALKIIPRKIMEQDVRSGIKITREIKILKVLRHPNIMRLYDVVQTKHDIVLVLEYISGGELFDCICRKGRLDEETARYYFQQIVAGIAYCHRYRVAHRDLKPENIMVEQNTKCIKIGDFGLSSVMRDGCFFETSCGTPNYASPEVVSGKLYGGPETDVWSCGVVLYTMLAGALPFDDQNVGNLFKKIQTANYVMPSDISDPVRDLLRRMLLVSPLDRATMEQVMQHPWVRPAFPPHLLAVHYDAIFDTMRPATMASPTENLLDDSILQTVAGRFHISVAEVAAIVSVHAKQKWSMLGDDDDDPSRRPYPAEPFFRTYANVVDAKLWPEPLVIAPAEQALRDQQHDVLITYLILLQRKQSHTPPNILAKMGARTEATGSLLMSLSMNQGYGSLNANSLHLFASSTTQGGRSLQQASLQPSAPQQQPHQLLKGQKNGDITFFGSLPAHVPQPDAQSQRPSPYPHVDTHPNAAESYLDGYNRLAEVVLPLRLPRSRHTLLGRLLGVTERPVAAQPAPPPSLPARSGTASAGGLLQPLLKPLAEETAGAARETRGEGHASGRAESAEAHEMDLTLPDSAPPNVMQCEATTRFGGDFMRNGVLFSQGDPRTTLRYVYMAMRDEGLLWKVIHPYFFSAVMHPCVKLQVKVYKVTAEEQIVDVKVSCQSGMQGYDVAVKLLDRLRAKSIALVQRRLRKSLLVGDHGLSQGSANNSFAAGETAASLDRRGAPRAFPG